ncbi:MAG TPA: UbiA family prenyltransferase [Candidatus Lustribacter sp.]|nr:UbiA family prenyltransferase [Candidatus Lustribacter sp.]
MTRTRRLRLLARVCHPAPTAAVTTLACLLALSRGLAPSRVGVVTLAVLTGQLTIGWSNDLVDADRDRQSGRADKPLAQGELPVALVYRAIGAALVVCVAASFWDGWSAGLVHLGLVVSSGWVYNLWLKRTAASFLPYAVAFGALPAFVTLSGSPAVVPPWWLAATGALLGVGAHFVNVLPDLADDAATGVQGLPHRMGERGARSAAAVALLGGSAVSVLGPIGRVPGWAYAGLGLAAALAIVTVTGRGKAPFRAAIGIALVDVVVLVLRS